MSEKTYRQYVIDAWFESINDELSLAEAASNGHWEGECREQLAILNDYQALEAERDDYRTALANRNNELYAVVKERDRYMAALETIELMDPDWTLGVDENMGRLQSIAGRALKGGGDET